MAYLLLIILVNQNISIPMYDLDSCKVAAHQIYNNNSNNYWPSATFSEGIASCINQRTGETITVDLSRDN